VSSREIASIREPRGPARVGIREAAEPQLPAVSGGREGIAALPASDGTRHEPAVALADREGATVRRGGGV